MRQYKIFQFCFNTLDSNIFVKYTSRECNIGGLFGQDQAKHVLSFHLFLRMVYEALNIYIPGIRYFYTKIRTNSNFVHNY